MTIPLQPALMPVGAVTLPNGQSVPVYVTVEWYRMVEALVKQINHTATQTGTEL